MAAPPAPHEGTATTVLDNAKASAKALLGRRRASGGPDATRVLTIGRSADELRALLGDADRLATVVAEPYTGTPSGWTIDLVEEVDGRVRFTARSAGATPSTLTGSAAFAPAPQQLGTEVTLAITVDAPDPAAGAMAFKMLHRAKALAETGEIPTLAHNSSARPDDDDTDTDTDTDTDGHVGEDA